MSDFLQQMATLSAERAAVAANIRPRDLDKPVLSLRAGQFELIAEIKAHSPAEGALVVADENRCERARQYELGGAAAISVLTEPSCFAGDLLHVEEVVAAVPDTPVMRKDFLVDTVQVLEARAAGASGVLLITTMLTDTTLRSMLDCAREHGLFVLLESFDKDDLLRSARLLHSDDQDRVHDGQLLFGVNTRNLRTLAVDPDRLQALAPFLPIGRCVAESGLHAAEDARRVAGFGYAMALVGTALMCSDDPASLISAMRDAGAEAMAA